MTVKGDPPASASSQAGETTSLLSQAPPTYGDSTSASGPYAAQPLYPALPQSSRPMGPTPYTAIPIPAVQHLQEGAMQAADRRARRRIFEALFWGFAIWFAVGMLTGGIIDSETRARRHRGSGGWSVIRDPPIQNTIKCNGFESSTSPRQPRSWLAAATLFHPVAAVVRSSSSSFSTATSTFSLPLAEADTLFLHGSGSWSHGVVSFVVDSSLKSGNADVIVVAKYRNEGLLEDSNVCQVRENVGSKGYNSGIEIRTPQKTGWFDNYDDQLTFDITYRIPSSLSFLYSLNVSTSIFVVSSTALPKLSSLTIVTSNAPITLDSVVADTISLKTTNAPIRVGSAEASRSIQVRSTNGRIEGSWKAPATDVATSNAAISGTFDVYKSLAIQTSNLGIDVIVVLKEGSEFDIVAKTSNGRVKVDYTEQPKGSVLTSEVTTSNQPATVLMHPQYEGSFLATSSNLGAKVTGPFTLDDPSSSRRERHIEVFASGPASSSGTVWWSDAKGGKNRDRASRGSTSVKSSNAQVELQFM